MFQGKEKGDGMKYIKNKGNEKIRSLLARNEGFTLVELMVVVAIIGVLASLAIPQYSKFTAKSRQSEAKISLGAMRTAIESYRPENGLTTCLRQAGYEPAAQTYYASGFSDQAANACGPQANQACTAFTNWAAAPTNCAAGDFQFAATRGEGGGVAATLVQLPNAVIGDAPAAGDPHLYNIGVAGRIRNASNAIDTWTIDQGGNLNNTVNGI